MNLSYALLLVYMFSLATFAFIMEFKHMLSSLMCLEFIVLIIFLALCSSSYSIYNELLYSMSYIAVAVCEAALGLGITVVYVNKKGNEMLKTF